MHTDVNGSGKVNWWLDWGRNFMGMPELSMFSTS